MEKTVTPAPGDLLVAPPEMRDPNFRRSVVLVCEHADDGSFGLILNRPLEVQLRDLPLNLGSRDVLSLGGPVQTDTLHYLHLHGDLVSKSILVKDGLYWGGDFELIRSLMEVEAAGPEDLRFFLGYAGWVAGQLEEEIRRGGWYVVRDQHALTFTERPADLWRTVLVRMGGEYALLVNYPDDLRVN